MDDSDKLHDARDAMEGDGALDGPEILRAVAAGCYLMAIADGSVSPDERRRIAKTLVALSRGTFGLLEVGGLIDGAAEDVQERGADAVTADIARALSTHAQRCRALAYAAAVAWVDGVLDFEEEVLIYKFADALAVSQDEVRQLLERFKQHVQP